MRTKKNVNKKIIKNKKYKSGNKTFKKMNCNPAIEGKRSLNESCYTITILNEIKKSYNKNHPEKQIKTNNPTELWKELKTRLHECDKEDCWLKEIENTSMRKKIDALTFAPDQPPEWKNNPDEWLSNFDIFEVLKQYEETHKNFKVIGPTPIDFDSRVPDEKGECVWKELCSFSLEKYLKEGKTKIGIVFNLDKHNEPGSHWVSLFIDLENDFLFYLDSAGDKIPDEIDVLVKRVQKQALELEKSKKLEFYENHPFEHQKGNTECGMYSLFFIITMLTQKIDKKVFNDYRDVIKMFKKQRISDENVFRYRNIYFNSN